MVLRMRRTAGLLGRMLATAWIAYLGAYLGAGMVTHLAAGHEWPPASAARFLPGAAWFATLMFVVTLVQTSPAWAALALVRQRLGTQWCTLLGAVLFAVWGEWWIYRMEWFDVWRHGIPGWRYWLTVVVPAAVAWGTGGAVLGSAIGRLGVGPPAAVQAEA